MNEYEPNPFSGVLVWLSCATSVLGPGVCGILLSTRLFVAITGIGPNDPIPLSVGIVCAISMLIVRTLGAIIGGIVWTLLINILLPPEAVRYWASYPAPRIPVLTTAFDKLNALFLNRRGRRKEKSEAEELL